MNRRKFLGALAVAPLVPLVVPELDLADLEWPEVSGVIGSSVVFCYDDISEQWQHAKEAMALIEQSRWKP